MNVYGMKSVYPETRLNVYVNELTHWQKFLSVWKWEIKPALIFATVFTIIFMMFKMAVK